ncbi:hypothetical protein JXA56_05205, partial [Candidatus Micrarchaeota archaeon]|nr:hypothetical protein [Candidatus Micrarchaeota archaeon]
ASDKNPENFLLSTSSRIRIFEKISKSHFSMSVAVECTALAQWEKTTPQQRKKLELIIKRNLEVLPPTFYERGIAKGMLEFIQSGETLPLPEICEYRKKMLQPL